MARQTVRQIKEGKQYMRVIGIDPGKTGALVTICEDRSLEILPFKKTEDLTKRVEPIINEIYLAGDIYLENVHSFPGQGVSATFTFGVNVGRIQGLIVSQNQTWESVTPMLWQKTLGLTGPYPTKVLRKQAHVKKAKELFPDYKDIITLDTADAILIAEYGYRKEMQKWSYENGI
jgi:hypothetical protein